VQNIADSSLLHDDLSKGERTRAALVAAAIRRFAIDGFQRTSVADVARDVGMTAGAPYRYFADKETLFLAAVDADGADLIELVRTSVFAQMGGSVSATLGRLTDQLGQALEDHPLVARVMSGAEPMGPERIVALPNLAALRTELTALLQLGQDAGLVRRGSDPAVLALGIETAVLYQLAHIASLRGSTSRPDTDRWSALASLIESALEPCPKP
jgi:AcrR family transcriptional regulator